MDTNEDAAPSDEIGIEVAAEIAANLSFIYEPHPNSPGQTGVFLQNLDPDTGIIATVRVEGGNLLVHPVTSSHLKEQRWPVQFEVRIPAGGRQLLGFQRFTIYRRADSGNIQRETIIQAYRVVGAISSKNPLPYPPADPQKHLRLYGCPVTGQGDLRWLLVAVNLHPFKSLAATFYQEKEAAHSVTVAPGGFSLFAQSSEESLSYVLHSAEWLS